MNRPARIALNIVGPPLIAAFLIMSAIEIGALFSESAQPNDWANSLMTALYYIPVAVIYAYKLAALPSLIHAMLLEWVYRRYPANTWNACLLSGVSGAFAGVLINITNVIAFSDSAGFGEIFDGSFFILPGLGMFVGFLLGLAIKRLSRKQERVREKGLSGCE